MSVCGYCGAEDTSKHGERNNRVHEVNCPFTSESDRLIRTKLQELEDRVDHLETLRLELD